MKRMLLIFVFLIATFSWATDKYAVASSSWNSTATWSLTRGGASGAAIPTSSDNVIIPSPFAVVFDASSKPCLNLTIESGGTLTQGGTGSKLTPRYLNFYGTTLTVNGTFGEPLGCIGIKPYNASTTFTGTPTAFYFTRIQPQVANLVLTFDCNCTTTYGGSSWPLGGSSAIYCNALASTFTINAGKTLTMDTAAYFSVGTSGSNDPSNGANLTINVYGTLTQILNANSNINLRDLATFSTVLHVYSTGTVNVGNSMLAPSATGAANVTVTVDGGGKVNFLNTDGNAICDLSKATTTMSGTWDYNGVSSTTRSLGNTAAVTGTIRSKSGTLSTAGTLNLNSGSTVEYYGSTITSLPSSITSYPNLSINCSVPCTLAVGTTVGNLSFSPTSGNLFLNGFGLNVTGNLTGASASHYIKTDGTSGLTIPNVGASNVSFPIGTSDYTPAVLNNSGSSDNFTVTVKDGLDHAPVLTGQTLKKQWTITEAGSGANVAVTLQWNTTSTDEDVSFLRTGNLVIGRWNGSAWEDKTASANDLGGNVYSATASGFNAFSPFTVGNLGALPVELSSFTSNVNGRDINLNWTTKTEKNSNKFEVERFVNQSWVNIGSVKASVLSNSPKQYSYTDKGLQTGKYQYRLKMFDNNGSFQYSNIVESEVATPKDFSLSQNYPNPFNPSTKINYALASDSKVTIDIYSISGQRIAQLVNENQSAGFYTVNFMDKNISSGVYFYHLIAVDKTTGNNFSSIKKMILLK
jgi:hypothetical protein